MQNELPTTRQLQVLKCVDTLTRRLGHSPSLSELAEALGVNRSAVAKILNALIEKGLLGAKEVVVRSNWRVTAAGRRWLESKATRS